MNNFRKITLGILGATILSLGLYACSNDNETTTNNNPTEQTTVAGKEIRFVNMIIPEQIQSFDTEFDVVVEQVVYKNVDGQETEGQIRFRVPQNDFKIVSIEFSENLLEVANMTPDFLVNNSESLLQAYGDPENDKDKDGGLQGDDRSHGERMKWCYDNFPKKEGRGGCVGGEWVTTVGKAVKGLFKR